MNCVTLQLLGISNVNKDVSIILSVLHVLTHPLICSKHVFKLKYCLFMTKLLHICIFGHLNT